MTEEEMEDLSIEELEFEIKKTNEEIRQKQIINDQKDAEIKRLNKLISTLKESIDAQTTNGLKV